MKTPKEGIVVDGSTRGNPGQRTDLPQNCVRCRLLFSLGGFNI